MSWKFGNPGGKADPNQVPANADLNSLQNLSGSGLPPNANINEQLQVPSGYTFDPTDLERAVKAAREFETLKSAVLGIAQCIAVFYTAKLSTRILGRIFESRIYKPSLVRETSRLNINDMLGHPLKTAKRHLFRPKGDAFKGLILQPELQGKLGDLLNSIKTAGKKKEAFGNVLLYGPPGTGKTLVAKRLAAFSEIDYAMVAGQEVAPLGAKGVTAVRKLFDWASRSRRGTVVCIDNADAFLRKRETLEAGRRACVSAFLHHTGTPSKKFMLILISDRPSELDTAVINRIGQRIKFELPTLQEREILVRLYFQLDPSSLKPDNFDYDSVCSKIANQTDGLSPSEIALLCQNLQTIYHSSGGVLDEARVMKLVEEALNERSKWELEIKLEKEKTLNSNLPNLDYLKILLSSHKKDSN